MCWGGGLGRGVGFKEEEKMVDCGVTEDPAMMELMKLIVDRGVKVFYLVPMAVVVAVVMIGEGRKNTIRVFLFVPVGMHWLHFFTNQCMKNQRLRELSFDFTESAWTDI